MSKFYPFILYRRHISAIKNDDVATVKSLIEAGTHVDARDSNGNTALHIAVIAGSVKSFDYFLTLDDAPLDVYNVKRETPLTLTFCCDHEDLTTFCCVHEDLAMKLIERKCDVNLAEAISGRTPLHFAISKKWLRVSEKLIEKGAVVNCQEDSDRTPLYLALYKRLIDEVFLLISFGADPTILDADGFTFIDLLTQHDNPPAVQDFFLNAFYDDIATLDFRTFIYLMRKRKQVVPKLIKKTREIRIHSDRDFYYFCKRIIYFNPKHFKLFLEKFPSIVEKAIVAHFETIFHSDYWSQSRLKHCDNYMYTIFDHHAISSSVVQKLKNKNFRTISKVICVLNRYEGQLETLTKLVCFLLSHGMDLYSEDVDKIYETYGYCDLFRIMLHMDIEIEDSLDQPLVPRMIYDVNMTFDELLTKLPKNINFLLMLFEHCSLPELKKYCLSLSSEALNARILELPAIPTLVELARNSLRAEIVDKYKIKNSRQFYTVLQKLPIAKVHKQLVAFEKILYPSTCDWSKINIPI